MKAEAYAYEKPDCKLDKVVKYTALFPEADASALWTEPAVLREEAKGEYKKLYKFQNPVADRLPSSLTEFCLLVSTTPGTPAGRHVRMNGQAGQAEVPTVTLVFHSSAVSRGVASSLLASLSALLSAFLLLS
ncbi:toxoplasma gondii family a protein [Cystoisospora suis]|uniref:Toxoplasma gondii family a protein n=1 Tax=Cystoisospora suis TaxID=483139 RepID=A0A2C6KJJ3_9APIC|nr:toxoplasma gondii family a protein [Cystoisospora suis]